RSKYSTRQGHQSVSISFFGNSADISDSFFLREAVSFLFGESRFARRKVEQPFLSLLLSFRAEVEEPLNISSSRLDAAHNPPNATLQSGPSITKPTQHAPGSCW
ncbi:MAG: hypothetical protein DME87_09000, partial [Verrucomicrobia bacterium]